MIRGELADYMRDINATPLLTLEEEVELAGRNFLGDGEARDRLVESNLRLVVKIQAEYQGRGVEPIDLVSEGNLGLIRAVESFDPSFAVRFSTYASYWIKQSLRSAVVRRGKPIRVPSCSLSRMSRWKATAASLAESMGREATQAEIAGALNYSASRARRMGVVIEASTLSFHSQEGSDLNKDGDVARTEIVDDWPGPDQVVSESDEVEWVMARMHLLTDVESRVIKMRCGLAPFAPMTLSAIGRVLGKSKEAIRNAEKKAVAKLSGESPDPVPPRAPTPEFEDFGTGSTLDPGDDFEIPVLTREQLLLMFANIEDNLCVEDGLE